MQNNLDYTNMKYIKTYEQKNIDINKYISDNGEILRICTSRFISE